VAARFVLREEELHEQTEAVLTDYREGSIELHAPPIIMSEVGSAIRKAWVRGLITEEEALNGYSSFINLGVSLTSQDSNDLRGVLKTAMGLKVSFYDAEYLVTSIGVGAPLLTADDALFRVVGEAGRGQHLRDYKAA